MTDDERAVMYWTLHAIRIENRAHEHSIVGSARAAKILYTQAQSMRENITAITRSREIAQ